MSLLNQEKELQDHCIYMRGSVLTLCIGIERLIDEFIATFFCKNEYKNDFVELIVNTERMSFESKRVIADCILRKYFPDVYREKYEIVLKYIAANIIPKRNNFAHYFIDFNYTEEQLKEGGVRLTKIRNNKNFVWISNSELVELMNQSNKYAKDLAELIKIANAPQM